MELLRAFNSEIPLKNQTHLFTSIQDSGKYHYIYVILRDLLAFE